MANKDMPNGFHPVGEPRMVIAQVAGAAIYKGEALGLSADGKVDPLGAATDVYGIAMTTATADGDTVMVSVHPDQLYYVQADGSDVDAQTDIGQTCDLLDTAPDTTYEISRHELDSSDIGSGTDGQFVVLDISKEIDNALGAQTRCVVKINRHQIFGEDSSAGV